ncbi:molybdopterin-dependent oxidoreductase [Heliobacillus mobilis]|uniref:Molybdopterin-dependent oxidoreductase n=1 Tax=Heliobacterium mobile TaxID=28064 RepID=A0A6I3SK07_HELMO|nr:molybdopterin-dependent oxidoreductase [Heliobacterium mobile]MTV49210.1 molybdopterin-dependent oxidoreductase [Heliobacterium mobile]
MSTREIITTCTRDCPNACGLIAKVENGRVRSLLGNRAHPISSQGCHKCAKFVERAYSPERVTSPLRREGDRWRRISWDEALDEIAWRMNNIKSRHGAEALLYYRGFAQRTALKLLNERFFNLFGGVTGTRGTLCGGTGQASQNLDFGERISHDPLDHQNSRSMILWGRNPAATNPYLLPIMARIRKAGGTVILIDPVASETRKHCDHHIQPAPGTDAFLAMAAAKRILDLGKANRFFLTECSEGFEAFQHILDPFTVDELADRCDVPVDQIELLAHVLIDQFPTAILLGWGLHRWAHAHHGIRAIDGLGAIAGIIGVPGGGISQGFEEYAPFDLSWTDDHLHPDRRRFLMPRIGQEILDAQPPPIEMIFVTAGNPVCMAPNANKVAEAFAKTPFVVVSGHFLDDTARHAHIFLPSTTFLEEQDIVASYGHNYIGPVNRAIEPLGECKSDFEMFRALASRFPFARDFNRPPEQWLSLLLAPTLSQGVALDDLWSGYVRMPGAPLVPYQDRVFPTPSGKFRFMTDFTLPDKHSSPVHSGLPIADPVKESLISAENRDIDSIYPYHLLSVSPFDWLCSELTPEDQSEMTLIRMHPSEASKRGIAESDIVEITSLVGKTKARVHFDERQRRDTIVFPRGKWLLSDSSANVLTLDLVSDVGSGSPYYETRVTVRKWE